MSPPRGALFGGAPPYFFFFVMGEDLVTDIPCLTAACLLFLPVPSHGDGPFVTPALPPFPPFSSFSRHAPTSLRRVCLAPGFSLFLLMG